MPLVAHPLPILAALGLAITTCAGCDRPAPVADARGAECASLTRVVRELRDEKKRVDQQPGGGVSAVRMGLASMAAAAGKASTDVSKLAPTVAEVQAAARELGAAATRLRDVATVMDDKLGAADAAKTASVDAANDLTKSFEAFDASCGAAPSDASGCTAVRKAIATMPDTPKAESFEPVIARVKDTKLRSPALVAARDAVVAKLVALTERMKAEKEAKEAQKPARDDYKAANAKLDATMREVDRVCH